MPWSELGRLQLLPSSPRERVLNLLRAAPWLMPLPGEPGHDEIIALFPNHPILAPSPGCVPLLSEVTSGRGSIGVLWALRVEEGIHGDGQFDAATSNLWREIALDLSRHVPLIFSSVHDVVKAGFAAQHIERAPEVGTIPEMRLHEAPFTLKGESFGLSFALAQVSWLLEVPPPLDIAASAAIESGRLRQVSGIGAKVSALLAGTSRVRRFLVADAKCDAPDERPRIDNAAEARDTAKRLECTLEVFSVSTIREAIALAYPNLTHDALIAFEASVFRQERHSDLDRRRACERLLKLALATDAWMNNWTPLRVAAESLLSRWGERLDSTDTWILNLVVAITKRHQGDDVPVELPTDEVLRDLEDSLKIRVAAQLVQQAHDSDDMEYSSVVALTAKYLHSVPVAARALPHQQLRGALARLQRLTASPITNDVEKASVLASCVAEQHAIIEQIYALNNHGSWILDESSFQLSELYVLASIAEVDDTTVPLDTIERLLLRLRNELKYPGDRFVALARARAHVMLDKVDSDTQANLIWLIDDEDSPATHVRRSACRLLARSLRARGRYEEAEARVLQLHQMSPSDGDSGEVFVLLCDVDRWVAEGQPEGEAQSLAARLQRLRAERRMMGFGRFVAGAGPHERLLHFRRYFPY